MSVAIGTRRTDHRDDDEILGKAYDHRIMKRLLTYLSPYARRLTLAVAIMMVAALANLVGPYIAKLTIDGLIAGGGVAELDRLALLYVLNGLLHWLASWQQLRLVSTVGQDLLFDLRLQFFTHLQSLSLSFYDRSEVGRLMSRLQNDIGVLNEMLTGGLVQAASDLLTLVAILAIMFSMDARLSLLTFAVLPLMAIMTAHFRVEARESYRQVRRAIARVNASLQENISGVRVIQSFTREELNLARFQEVNRRHLQANLRAGKLAAIFFPSVEVVGALATALVIAFGGFQVLQGQLTPGALVAFTLYIGRFFDPIRDLSQRYNTMQSAMAAGERIFELLDTHPTIVEPADALELTPLRGEVELRAVSFAYIPGQPVLQAIDLHVRPGETVALVGETGAGKTTLAHLVGRFYDVTGGAVLIDGVDVRRLSLRALRRQMGMVLQDTFLFGGSVAENIRYGRPTATAKEVMAAASAVGADAFIRRLPQGYDTEVEERGAKLSVGQRQLLSFARALLADPRLLILDEATSSVDPQTEAALQEALRRLLAGRTAFIIAHRLSTVRIADRIVVVEGGRIAEMGSHEELLARRGRYYELYTAHNRT